MIECAIQHRQDRDLIDPTAARQACVNLGMVETSKRNYHAENGSVGSNSQRQREDRHASKSGIFYQSPEAIFDVLQQSIHIHPSWWGRFSIRYSYLNATIGSTFAARLAGI
jgi:hypothetical protein